MTHLQKAPRKPLLNTEQGKVFISHLDDDLHKKIANDIFVEGMTSEEVGDNYFFCTRQVERIRIGLLKTVLKKLIEKQIQKKPLNDCCPSCQGLLYIDDINFCYNCGQALDWSDTDD